MADFETSLDELLVFCDEGLRKTAGGCRFFFDSLENQWIHYVPRLLILLNGSVDCETSDGRYLLHESLPAPGICFCSRRGYFRCEYRSQRPCRILSFSFYPEYIRAMHIDFDGVQRPPTSRDVYFHTETPLSDAGNRLIDTIDALHAEGHDEMLDALPQLLLKLAIQNLRQSRPSSVRSTLRIWEDIHRFIRAHREENFSRAQLAKLFRISPGYISKLAMKYTKNTFSELQLGYRLEHAANYLEESDLTVAEIAYRCGFANISYFIRRFKNRYHQTPFAYRNHPENHLPNMDHQKMG